MSEVGNWIGVRTDTQGTGLLTLGGSVPGYVGFDSIGDGDFYYAILDGENRESGECTVTGPNMTRRPSYTLFDGTFSGGSPAAISLSGLAEVYCTFNKDAFDLLTSSILALQAVQGDYILRAGDTMTGVLTLAGDGVLALEAVTLQQMQIAIAAGSGGLGTFVQIIGDTMTGNLTIDTGVAGPNAKLIVKDGQPTSAAEMAVITSAGGFGFKSFNFGATVLATISPFDASGTIEPKNYMAFVQNADVILYYANSLKARTAITGLDVLGVVGQSVPGTDPDHLLRKDQIEALIPVTTGFVLKAGDTMTGDLSYVLPVPATQRWDIYNQNGGARLSVNTGGGFFLQAVDGAGVKTAELISWTSVGADVIHYQGGSGLTQRMVLEDRGMHVWGVTRQFDNGVNADDLLRKDQIEALIASGAYVPIAGGIMTGDLTYARTDAVEGVWQVRNSIHGFEFRNDPDALEIREVDANGNHSGFGQDRYMRFENDTGAGQARTVFYNTQQERLVLDEDRATLDGIYTQNTFGVNANDLLRKDQIQGLIAAIPAPSLVLNDLTDVSVPFVTAGQVLSWNGSAWVGVTPAAGVTDHTLLTNIGTNTHAVIDSHIADATIHFTQAAISITKSQVSDFSDGDYATAAQGTTADSALQNITGEVIADLSNVVLTTETSGQVLEFNGVNWVNVTPSAGITDHTLLTNIGVNTHAQIDSHIGDSTIHFTQASISITKSQVSDFSDGDYATAAQGALADSALQNITGESIGDLSDVTLTGTPANQELIMADGVGGFSNEPLYIVAAGTGADSIAIGSGATAQISAVAIGKNALAVSTSAAIGLGAITSGGNALALGYVTNAGDTNAIALGSSTNAQTNASIAIGALANFFNTAGTGSCSIGYFSKAEGVNSVAIGYFASSPFLNSIALGNNSTATAASQIALGNGTHTVYIAGALQVVGAASGIDPVLAQEFVTKAYGDANYISAGVTDHGALTGLADNDHPQYLLAVNAITDHGALTGLGDNDHPQYARLSGATFTGAVTSTTDIEAGRGSGSVALAINDGYGNASIAFNHRDGTPDFTGSSCRIETSVDGATATMNFELLDNTTVGVPVGLNTIMTLNNSNVTLTRNLIGTTAAFSGAVTGSNLAIATWNAALQSGDNVSTLVNDAGYLDNGALYATAAQGTLANSATQPGDNVSTLVNDAGYLTTAAGYLPLTGGTLTGPLTVNSASGTVDASFRLQNSVDNTGWEMNNSESGGGFELWSTDASAVQDHLTFACTPLGEAALYYQSSEKLQTTNTGIVVTGGVDVSENSVFRNQLTMFKSTDVGHSFTMYHSVHGLKLTNYQTTVGPAGTLTMTNSAGTPTKSVMNWYVDGLTRLYHDGNPIANTAAAGWEINGKLMATRPIAAAAVGVFQRGDSTTVYQVTIQFNNSAGAGQGVIETRNGAIPRFVAPSDERLKSNIVDADRYLAFDRVMGIQVRDYEVFSDFSKTESFGFSRGVVAQEYEPLYPDLVTSDEDDPFGVKKVAARDWELVMAMQVQQDLINNLESRISSLGV